MQVERREFQRYCVRDKAYAVVKDEHDRLVPIIDISLGGLGFYVNGLKAHLILNRSSSLEIIVSDCSFFLDNLNYLPRSEYRYTNWNAVTFLQNRFYGVQFDDLMSSQKIRLNQFIRKHTYGGKTPQFVRKFNQYFHQTFGKKQFQNSCQTIWQ